VVIGRRRFSGLLYIQTNPSIVALIGTESDSDSESDAIVMAIFESSPFFFTGDGGFNSFFGVVRSIILLPLILLLLPSSSILIDDEATTTAVGLPFGIPDRLLFRGRMILDDDDDDEIVRVVLVAPLSSCAAATIVAALSPPDNTDDSDPGVVSSIGREVVLLLLLLAVATVSVDEDGAQNATSSPLCTNDLCATFQLSDRLIFFTSLVLSEIFGTSGKRIS